MNRQRARRTSAVRRATYATAFLLVASQAASWTGQARAHVLVTPTQSILGAAETYVVTVPSERPVATTAVSLRVPSGVVVYQFGPLPPGWTYSLKEDPQGSVTEIDWVGGSIPPTQFAQFSFMARNPASGRQLTWAATQTYADGLAVRWAGGQGSQQPASLTALSGVAATATPNLGGDGSSGSSVGSVALAVGGLALGLSLLANGLLIALLRRKVL